MADENQEVDNKQQEETQITSTEDKKEVEYTTDELSAMDHGWRPKDEWQGDPDDWVSAREFNRRGELFARISKYGNENRELRESVKKLFDHNRKIYDAGYRKALDDLKLQRSQALEDGDIKKFNQVEDQIDTLKEEHTNAVKEFDQTMAVDTKAAGPNLQQTMIFNQWADANPWYGKNEGLTRIADNIAHQMVARAKEAGKEMDYGRLLNQVAKEVRDNNPEHFAAHQERRTSAVEGNGRAVTTRKAGGTGRYSLSNIPEQEREIARTIMASTGMKEEDYVKQYMDAEKRGR